MNSSIFFLDFFMLHKFPLCRTQQQHTRERMRMNQSTQSLTHYPSNNKHSSSLEHNPRAHHRRHITHVCSMRWGGMREARKKKQQENLSSNFRYTTREEWIPGGSKLAFVCVFVALFSVEEGKSWSEKRATKSCSRGFAIVESRISRLFFFTASSAVVLLIAAEQLSSLILCLHWSNFQ